MVAIYRVKDALELHDNDAFLDILLCFDHYRWLLDQFPARIEKSAEMVLAGVGLQAEKVVRAEIASASRRLAEEVSRAADSVAHARAERARWVAKWWASAVLTLFGAVCMVAGFELGRGGLPFWMRPEVAQRSGVERVVGAVLGAPAGWTALMLLVPLLLEKLQGTWQITRDTKLSLGERRKAGGYLAGAVLAAVAWIGLLIFLLGGRPWRW
jgi:hypothetical protein